MAASDAKGNKRKLGKAAGGQPQKRHKGSAAKSKPPAGPRRVVGQNEIQWKTVALPEMFADAEGFFGLEEVEGVDVVREGNAVQFVTTAPAATGDDEFAGFDDVAEEPKDDITSGTEAPETDEPVKPKKAKKEKKAKDKTKQDSKNAKQDKPKKTGKAAPAAPDAELGGGFAMLADLEDDAAEDAADVSAWVPLDLAPPLLSCLARLKFNKPTEIQTATIPAILAGHDVIGKASTGSGKTLAFGIPVVQHWLVTGGAERSAKKSDKKTEGEHIPTALVLSPTRELAHQITTHIQGLCAALPVAPYVCAVTGGLSVLKQQRQLAKADIVVGTPGRLWEVLSASKPLMEAFRSVSFLVVDEADRLLSEGHFKEVEEILSALDREVDEEEDEEAEGDHDAPHTQKPRQTLVFSATFNRGLQQKLAGTGRYDLMDQKQSMEHLLQRLNFREADPTFVDVNPVAQMAARLREGMVECGGMEKDLYLYALLLLQPTRRTLVFANSISSVRRLAPLLQNLGLPAIALHSQMPQKARLRAVERFKAATDRRGAVLLATDVAARGLDIPGIDVVIHYHVPRTAGNYVHRSGRTARAARAGLSVLLCAPEEVVPTRRLVAKIHAVSGKGEDEDGDAEEDGNEKEKTKAKPKTKAKNMSFYIHSIDIDRRLVARLRERVVLAKQLADSSLAREKGSKDDNWLREAADELGVEYDSDGADLERAGSWSGRGSGRRSREKAARALSKGELAALRAQLRELLSRRVNVGVSERYLTAGGIDVDELLRSSTGDFLGHVDGLGMD